MASCNKTGEVYRAKNTLHAPLPLQSKIKSLFYVHYFHSSRSRGAEVFKIRLASSLGIILQSYIFSLYKIVIQRLFVTTYSKICRFKVFTFHMIQQCNMHLNLHQLSNQQCVVIKLKHDLPLSCSMWVFFFFKQVSF